MAFIAWQAVSAEMWYEGVTPEIEADLFAMVDSGYGLVQAGATRSVEAPICGCSECVLWSFSILWRLVKMCGGRV